MGLQSMRHRWGRLLDNILSPPPNFAILTYHDRLRRHWQYLCDRRSPVSNALHVCRLSYMIGMSYVLWPIIFVLKKSGFRFIDIDLSQIGSVIFLDLLIREDRVVFKTPRHKMFLLASHYKDGNRYLFDLYKPYGIFIRNPFLKFLLSPIFVSRTFGGSSFRYESVFTTKPVSHSAWNAYWDEYQRPLIRFRDEDLEKARATLGRYIPIDKPFVTLHVRDSGFYGDIERTTRNADIFTYKKAIEYLIAQGFTVVRLGNESASDIQPLLQSCGPRLFDYAHSDIRSDMMDCFLLSQCAFFVGGPSGPSSVAMMFGVNSCNLNWNNAANAPYFLEGDLTAIKKPRYKSDNSLVPFEKLLEAPLAFSPGVPELDQIGVYLENNTAEEVLETVKEFMERRPISNLQQQAARYYNDSHYAYGAKGRLADAILKSYFTA